MVTVGPVIIGLYIQEAVIEKKPANVGQLHCVGYDHYKKVITIEKLVFHI